MVKQYQSKIAWPLNMGPIGCPETSVTTNVSRITSQKSEYLIYAVAEAWNHILRNYAMLAHVICYAALSVPYREDGRMISV